jgi:hypothetical protein
MQKMCTLITSKGTDENIANQNHATRTRTPKPGRGILTSLLFIRVRCHKDLDILYVFFLLHVATGPTALVRILGKLATF